MSRYHSPRARVLLAHSLLVFAFSVCGCCPTSSVHSTPSAAPHAQRPRGPSVSPQLSWGPDGSNAISTRLAYCDTPADCRTIAIFYPPQRAKRAVLSPSAQFVLIAFIAGDEQEHAGQVSVHIYDRGQDRVIARINRLDRGSLQWTPFNQLLHIWSAGSDTTVAEALTPVGRSAWIISGPTIELAPSGQYALIYPHDSTPITDDHEVTLYAVDNGAVVARSSPNHRVHHVSHVVWSKAQVTVMFVDTEGAAQQLTLPTPTLAHSQ